MYENILVFILGICVGSFLNVCIFRLPQDMSPFKGRSFCPHCKKQIGWKDNIPVISYIFLRGRCRYCKEYISLRYPLVELLTGLIFLFLFIKYGFSLNFIKFSFFFSVMVVVSFIDIEYHAIPAYICVLGIVVGLLLSIYESFLLLTKGLISSFEGLPLVESLLGLFIGLGFTYFFKLIGDVGLTIYLSFRKKDSIEGEKESLGLGDVDFMGFVGTFLGWHLSIVTFFIAPFITLGYTVFALIFKKSHLIPYLPYLSVGAFISFEWGNEILKIIFPY